MNQKPLIVLCVGLVIAVSLAGLIAVLMGPPAAVEPDERVAVKDFEPPPTSETPPAASPQPAAAPLPSSPFQNTAPAASYLGSQACIQCHAAEHETYLQTGMGQSLAEVDPETEPADARFSHEVSGRRYEISRRDDRLYHRETLVANNTEHVLGDFPARYVVGSGKHARSYFMEIDGFLVESPVTWYATRQAWAMSPGYDIPMHSGFRREVLRKCLFCHAGQTTAIDNSLHRIQITEHAIGCERCHGPGSLHVEKWERQPGRAAGAELKDKAAGNSIDTTIVNPAHLSRELADAVCHQCHLTAEIRVAARGRTVEDFRPGLPLQYFSHYFKSPTRDAKMRVVGHVDQMMLSRCYLESDSLSCMTCHNPHGFPAAEARTAYFRDACLRCHQPQSCGVAADVLAAKSPENDCVACHMPPTPTDVPHTAFTHHRIGIHPLPAPELPDPAASEQLEPFHDLSFLTEMDLDRARGLALLALSQDAATQEEAQRYTTDGFNLLLKIHQPGGTDPEVDAAMAQVILQQDPRAASDYATAALQAETLSAKSRVNSLYALAVRLSNEQRFHEALPVLEQLTRMRRNAADWMPIGAVRLASQDLPGAIEAFETAVAIDPNFIEIHNLLARCYEQLGQQEKAARSRSIAAALTTVFENAQKSLGPQDKAIENKEAENKKTENKKTE